MSNLYKSQFVIKSDSDKRVIDSNVKIAERMQEYIAELKKSSLDNEETDGFVAGINAESVEVIETDEMDVQSENFFQQQNETVIDTANTTLENARLEAEEILLKARQEADDLKEEAYAAAKEEGFEAGKAKAEQEFQDKIEDIEKEAQQQKTEFRQKMQSMESELVDVMSDIYDQVFQVAFRDKKNILVYLIEKAMLDTQGCRQFRVHLSSEKIAEVSNQKEALLETLGEDGRIDFIEDTTLSEDQCLIETDCGIYDCGVGTQLQNLKKELKILSL